MNKIKKFKEELENYEKKYALLIKECIQEEINKINPEIEISIRSNDVNSIYVIYKNFNFEFRYVYFKCKNNEKLFFRGYGKTNTRGYSYDRYTKEEQKERERSYDYVRSILKIYTSSFFPKTTLFFKLLRCFSAPFRVLKTFGFCILK